MSLLGTFAFSLNQAEAYVSVKGYTKKNGTYVQPHVRSNPNGLKYDNYGYKPSQGLYNPSYGTKGIEWDTPTYITDPDYYLGKSLYEQNKSISGSSFSQNMNTKEEVTFGTKNVPYVVKTWSDSNPNISCDQSNFLRNKERSECMTYRMLKSGYKWETTINEFDGKHYIYNPDTKVTSSCLDGYSFLYDTKTGKLTNSCVPEIDVAQVLPAGCTTKIGFSPISGVSCLNNTCASGMSWNGAKCTSK